MDRKRLDELDREIAAANRRHGAAVLMAKSNELNDDAEMHRGPSYQAAEQARERALVAVVDLLLAKRANVTAGLPEDFGLMPPVNLAAIVGGQLDAVRKEMEHRFEMLRREVENGLARVIPRMLDLRSRSLEERIGAIEQRGVMYRGVWQRQAAYEIGDLATHRGSCWHANEPTVGAEPGSGPAWSLAVKAGRDGKDAGR